MEIHHRLQQLDSIQILPLSIRRFLVDEQVPAASVTLVPELSASDFIRLLETPTQGSLDYWILRGERSVWPAVGALKVRCAIESELDRGYQFVRRRKAGGLEGGAVRLMMPSPTEGGEIGTVLTALERAAGGSTTAARFAKCDSSNSIHPGRRRCEEQLCGVAKHLLPQGLMHLQGNRTDCWDNPSFATAQASV